MHWQDGPSHAKHFPLLVQQLYVVGVQSVAIILVSGLFIGMVLSCRGYNVLKDFGAEQSLGPLVSLSLLRELGLWSPPCCSPVVRAPPSPPRSA